MSKQIITLEAERVGGKLYSYKEIINFTNSFNSAFFKGLIIKRIQEVEFNSDSEASIWILDRSFQTNQQYYKLYKNHGVINLDEGAGLKSLYHLGNPVASEIDQTALLLEMSFNFFRDIQYILNKNVLISSYNKDLFFGNLENSLSNGNPKESIITFVDSIKNDYNEEIESLLNEERDAKIIKKINDTKNDINKLVEKNIRLIKYGKKIDYTKEKFYNLFKTLSQPIVGIKIGNKLTICGWEAVAREMFTESNDLFLETRLIKQQSPLRVELVFPLVIIAPFFIKAIKSTLIEVNEELQKELKKENPDIEKIKNIEGKIMSSMESHNKLDYFSDKIPISQNSKKNQCVERLGEVVTESIESATIGDNINIKEIKNK